MKNKNRFLTKLLVTLAFTFYATCLSQALNLFNVKHLNRIGTSAIGNGVADDAPAIRDAILHARGLDANEDPVSGATIYDGIFIPAGTYLLETPIDGLGYDDVSQVPLGHDVRRFFDTPAGRDFAIIGEDQASSILKTDEISSFFFVKGENIQIRNLQALYVGQGTAAPDNATIPPYIYALRVDDCKNLDVENVTFLNFSITILSRDCGAPITSIAVTNGGGGYTTATVGLPNQFFPGSAQAIINNGVITEIQVLDGGRYNTNSPAITINGDGTGATATASIGDPQESIRDTLHVKNCSILFTHGRASAPGMRFRQDTPYDSTLTGQAIRATGAKMTLIEGNYFNGLLDPTFTGATAPNTQWEEDALDASRVPMDGISSTHSHFSEVVVIRNNVVINNSVEGISVGLVDTIQNQTVEISENYVYGLSHTSPPALPNPIATGILYVPTSINPAEIFNNTVKNQLAGIGITDYGNLTIPNSHRHVHVHGNTVESCFGAIGLQGVTGGFVSKNTILGKSLFADIDNNSTQAPDYARFASGIGLGRCSDVEVSENYVNLFLSKGWTGSATVAAAGLINEYWTTPGNPPARLYVNLPSGVSLSDLDDSAVYVIRADSTLSGRFECTGYGTDSTGDHITLDQNLIANGIQLPGSTQQNPIYFTNGETLYFVKNEYHLEGWNFYDNGAFVASNVTGIVSRNNTLKGAMRGFNIIANTDTSNDPDIVSTNDTILDCIWPVIGPVVRYGVNFDSNAGIHVYGTASIGSNLTVGGNLFLSDGSATNPSIAFSSNSNSGFLWDTSIDGIGLSINGEIVGKVGENGFLIAGGETLAEREENPGYGFAEDADGDTGMYWYGEDSIGFAAGGIRSFEINKFGTVTRGTVAQKPTTSVGSAKSQTIILSGTTTSTTAVELTRDGQTASGSNRIQIEDGKSYVGWLTIVGRRSDGATRTMARLIHFKNVSGVSSMVGTTDDVAGSADTAVNTTSATIDREEGTSPTPDYLRIKVTGQSSQTFTWAARLELTEVSN